MDCTQWCTDGANALVYSSKTWEAMRPKENVRSWAKLIWFKGYIPKHSFTMWIANLDRLPTRSRLSTCGMQVPTDCCLCSTMAETRDHLLLTCDYSLAVWQQVLVHLNPPVNMFTSWSELLSWMKQSTSLSPSLRRKLVVHTTIFHLWK